MTIRAATVQIVALIASLLVPQWLPAAGLTIVNAAAHESEDGPPMAADAEFTPGETVYFSFQVAGYLKSPEKKVRFNFRIETLDPNGVAIIEPTESILDANVAEEDSQWKPKIRDSILIPPHAPGGVYKIRTTLTDDISHLKTTTDASFRVSGRAFAHVDELAIQNFGFYRGENETQAVAAPVFRAGSGLFARFDIAGFRYGDHNTVNVAYGVAVLNSDGKQIYAQPKAAEEKSFSFYPKPYVAGGMSLSLQPNMRPGEYTLVLTVHDEVGHQDRESRHAFQVE